MGGIRRKCANCKKDFTVDYDKQATEPTTCGVCRRARALKEHAAIVKLFEATGVDSETDLSLAVSELMATCDAESKGHAATKNALEALTYPTRDETNWRDASRAG